MTAKIFARVFDFRSSVDMDDGTMVFTVEWKRISASRDSGKEKFTVHNIQNDKQITDDLREQLCAFLSGKYAPEVFRPRDIVGYSV